MPRRPRIPLRTAAVLVTTLAVLAAAGGWLAPHWAGRTLERARQQLDATLETVPLQDRVSTPEASRWLTDGCQALAVGPEESARLADLVLRAPDDWTLSERDLVSALARREAEPLSMIERAGAAGTTPRDPHALGPPHEPRSGGDDPDELIALATPLRRGALLLLARAGLALETAPEEAGRSLVALAGSARALQGDPRPTAQHLGTEIEVLFLRGAHWAVASPATPREVILDLRAALPEPRAEERIRTVVARQAETVHDDSAHGWRRLVPGGSLLEEARRLDALARVVAASGEPGRLLEISAPGRPTADALGAVDEAHAPDRADDLAGQNLLVSLLRMQAADASAEVGRFALAVRARPGGAPAPHALSPDLEDLPADPFAGGRPAAQQSHQGAGARLVILNEAAAGAWSDRWGVPPRGPAPPPFAWTLPGMRPGTGRPPRR